MEGGDVVPVPDQFDVTLIDPELLTELEVLTDLMIAANTSPGALSSEAIDCILQGASVYAKVS